MDPDYIGDGVYVDHDGYQVWIKPDIQGRGVALEPAVFASLISYLKRVSERLPGYEV